MGELPQGKPPSVRPPQDRLDSWKEIAAYVNRDVTTVQRWEKREGMPVHRHLHDRMGSVYASRAELDAWTRSRNPATQENGNNASLPNPAAESPRTAISTSPPIRGYTKRRFLVAAAVAAVLIIVGAVAAWRVWFSRPALTESDVILLASFVNNTGDSIFDNSLDKALEVKLTESPFLSLFPEADVRETIRTMRQEPNQRVTRELGIEICKRQGLKALVVPEISVFGSRYLIILEAVDARTQKSIARRQEEAEAKDQVIAALGRAGSRLRRQMGESLSSLEKYDAPLDLATTSSLDALQAYRTGQTLYRSGKRGEAIAFFERAVELDPQFCSAYNMLGSAYHSIGDDQASKKNIARAFELKDRRLTREENFQTTALYHLSITQNLEKAAAVLVLLKQAYPRSAVAHNLLGIAYAQMGRAEESLQEFYMGNARFPGTLCPALLQCKPGAHDPRPF